jgi:capsular polysaccharide biosynthesis protein
MAHERTSATDRDDRVLYPLDPRERVLPRIGAFESVRRHWIIAIVPVLVLVAAAAVLGLKRAPTYTAETRMAVGGLDLSAPGALGGLALATQTLASSYSRAVNAEEVVGDVARRAGTAPRFVRPRITATPVPESPVFRIDARAGTPQRAELLANLTAASLVRYVKALNGGPVADADRFFASYQKAARTYQRAVLAREDAEQAFRGASPTSARRDAVIKARAAESAARLRRDALQSNYLTAIGGRVAVPNIQQLTSAASAKSDRKSRLALYVFVALLAGGLIGTALATLRANAQVRRHLTR